MKYKQVHNGASIRENKRKKLLLNYDFTIKILCFQDLTIFFAANAAIRTTRGVCPSVCLSACLVPLAFLPFTQKIFRQPIPQNLLPYAILFCAPMKKNVYEGVQHFLDTKYKIIFLL